MQTKQNQAVPIAPSAVTSGSLRSRMAGGKLAAGERPKHPPKIRFNAETVLDLEELIVSPAFEVGKVDNADAVYSNKTGDGVYTLYEVRPFIVRDENGDPMFQVSVSPSAIAVSVKPFVNIDSNGATSPIGEGKTPDLGTWRGQLWPELFDASGKVKPQAQDDAENVA